MSDDFDDDELRELEALAGKYGMPEVVTAYRMDFLVGDVIVGPYGANSFYEGGFESSVYETVSSSTHCQKDPEHVPPVESCTCGVYAVTDIREMTSVLKPAEFMVAAEMLNLRPSVHPNHKMQFSLTSEEGAKFAARHRVAISTGLLTSPIEHPPEVGAGAIVAYFDDGTDSWSESIGQKAMRRSGMSNKRVYGMYNMDPESTVRGGMFIRESLTVQLHEGDNPEALTLPVETNFVIGDAHEDLLSSVITRYAANPDLSKPWWKH